MAENLKSSAPTRIASGHPRTSAETVIVGCAVVVAAVWGFRTLYETGKEVKEVRSNDLKELAGLSAHPAHPAQFLIGYGFIFFTLSIVAMGAPEFAKTFAILVATGTTLANGISIFGDISNATTIAQNLESGSTTQIVTKRNVGVGENQVTRTRA